MAAARKTRKAWKWKERKADAAWVVMALAAIALVAIAYNQGLFRSRGERMYIMVGEGEWPEFEPGLNINPPPVPGNISFMELEAFRRVNMERQAAGLRELEWNGELAYVARLHSEDMVSRGYFEHEAPDGKTHDDRLHDQGIYYYNKSAENLAKISYISSYTYDILSGRVMNRTYRALGEVIGFAVSGWMNSTGHRENILIKDLDQSGMGVAYDPGNQSFHFTQLFITRVHCGYKDASCCRQGRYALCYRPWNCTEGICG